MDFDLDQESFLAKIFNLLPRGTLTIGRERATFKSTREALGWIV